LTKRKISEKRSKREGNKAKPACGMKFECV
jgi:hypothetical protein